MALIEKKIALACVDGYQSEGSIIVDITVDDFINHMTDDDKKQLVEWVNKSTPKISFKSNVAKNVIPFDELPKPEPPKLTKLTDEQVKVMKKNGMIPLAKQ